MYPLFEDYARSLSSHTFLFLPTCLVTRQMLLLYRRLAALPLSRGGMRTALPELLELLGTMSRGISLTSEAQKRPHTGFFPGDWRADRERARELFYKIAARLGQIHDILEPADRSLLSESIDTLTGAWMELERILEEKAATPSGAGCGVCRYFHNAHPPAWRRSMANVLVSLDQDADYGKADYLILLCGERLRQTLVSCVAEIARHDGAAKRFSPKRLLAASPEDMETNCVQCLEETSRLDEIALNAHGASCPLRRSRPERISLKRVVESAASTADFQRHLADPALGEFRR